MAAIKSVVETLAEGALSDETVAQEFLRRADQEVDRLVLLSGDAARTPGDARLLYRPAGCERCSGTGYRGRSAVLELMPMCDRIRRLVLERAETAQIRRAARAEGMRTMYEHGLAKAYAGLTSLEEVMRVTCED